MAEHPLKSLPPNVFNDRYYQNKAFDAMLIELPAQVRRPEEILGIWTPLDSAPAKAGGFDSPEAVRLSGLILDADDPDTRQSLLRQFDRLVGDQQPGTFLFQEIYIDAMSKRFTLSYPFSYSHYGFNWLQSARLRNE
jgi:ABC-type transport system substrate-binding protein